MKHERPSIYLEITSRLRDQIDREAGQRGVPIREVVVELIRLGLEYRNLRERHEALMKVMNGE